MTQSERDTRIEEIRELADHLTREASKIGGNGDEMANKFYFLLAEIDRLKQAYELK